MRLLRKWGLNVLTNWQARPFHSNGKRVSQLGNGQAYNKDWMFLLQNLFSGFANGPLQNFIFFVTYEWAQWAMMLHYDRLEMLAKDKPPSLLGPFVSYK